MRESWTDRRLDEFRESTERRFDRVDHRLEAIDQRFEMFEGNIREVREGINRVDNDLRELRIQIGSFQHVLFQFCGGMIVTVALGFAGLIVTHL
jgi:chromosome segregation ATPase